jgi:hypothetical protein
MSEKTMEFTPIDTGDMSEIPPDAPAGSWTASAAVTKSKTSKDGYPMLKVEWTLETATGDNADGNEAFEGARVTDFVVFFPATHRGAKMSRLRLRSICEALQCELPKTDSLSKGSWSDVMPFIADLDGAKTAIYTVVSENKETGEKQTQVRYQDPTKPRVRAEKPDADDEEDEEPKPVTKLGPNGRPLKKKKAA